MNKREAAEKWVNEFNAIPQALLVKAYKDDIDSVLELTKVSSLQYSKSESLYLCFNASSSIFERFAKASIASPPLIS